MPPNIVTVDSGAGEVAIDYSRWKSDTNYWTYDGQELTTIIHLSELSTNALIKINVNYLNTNDLDGVKGFLVRAIYAKRNLDEIRAAPGSHTPDKLGAPLSVAASTGDALSYLAGQSIPEFLQTVSNFTKIYDAAIGELKQQKFSPRMAYSVDLLQSVMSA